MDTLQTHEYNMIYVFSKDDIEGALKIGKTTVAAMKKEDLPPNCRKMEDAFKERMKSAATWGVTDIHLQYTEVACYDSPEGERRFDDHEIHDLLERSHYKKRIIETDFGDGNEWYNVDIDTAIKAIAAYKEGKRSIEGPVETVVKPIEIKFRDEQIAAIEGTITHYAVGDKMLWNAKMRFGKTLCALEVIRRQQYKKTLILTHRPTVRSGWYEDFHNIKFDNYLYGSKDGDKDSRCDIWQEEENGKTVKKVDTKGKDFETLKNGEQPYIYFASMQDLRGSKYIFGEEIARGESRGFDKNDGVFENDWDLIILDEAHEGTKTELGQKVIKTLLKDKHPKLLYLSGTPYNLLNEFSEEEIYTWDYVMEQNAKENWPTFHPHEPNPYEGLAKMHIYTYDLNEVYPENREIYTKEDYFSFAEFFRVWTGNEEQDGCKMPSDAATGQFVHEENVKQFLDLLCAEEPVSYYPFSNEEFRNALNHTFWLVPGVKQAAALEKMINDHRLHKEFGIQVINVAGSEKSISDFIASDSNNRTVSRDLVKEEKQEKDALNKVKKAVKEHARTITLSCGRLTTGVSVPEWTGVFMLSGGYKTGAASYMQAIFRAQTPYKDGAIKTNCYAFDFAPDRTLTVVNEYIKLQPDSSNTMGGDEGAPSTVTNASVENVMRYMPVIAMKGGQEVSFDAQKFVLEVNRSYSDFVRTHRFKGRALTKDFSSWSKQDHDLLKEIGKLIGGSKVKLNADGTVVVADNGETGTGGTRGNRRKKTTLTGKRTTRTKKTDDEKYSQNVLDQIYIRFPLLMFGAVEDDLSFNIDQLLSDAVIDNESWNQFMPEGFTKAIFNQIKHLIKVDALVASGIDIVKELKAADEKPIEERVKYVANTIASFHYADNETVLTPWRVVNIHMAHTLGGYNFYDDKFSKLLDEPQLTDPFNIAVELFCNEDAKVLELNSKSGVYPLWIAFTFWKLLGNEGMSKADQWELWKTVVERNLFVVCKTKMAEKITKRVLVGFHNDISPNIASYESIIGAKKNIIDILIDSEKRKEVVNAIKRTKTYSQDIQDIDTMLTFDAIVSNPPYQRDISKKVTSNGQKRSQSVFHHFQLLAEELGRYTSFIYPGKRWIHSSGKGVEVFGNKQINDDHLKLLEFFPDANEIFKDAGIGDGISIVLKDLQQKTFGYEYLYSVNGACQQIKVCDKPGQALMVLNPSDIPAADALAKVVISKEFKYLDDSIGSQKMFGIESDFVENNPTLVREYKDGDTFDIITEIKLLANDKAGKGGKSRWYIANEIVIDESKKKYLHSWKVVVSSANAGGQKRNNQIELLDNHSAFGRSRISLKMFDTEEEAKNFYKYATSEVIRFAFQLTDEALTSFAKRVPDIVNYKNDNGIIDFSKDVNDQLYKLFNVEQYKEHIQSVVAELPK